MKVEEEGLVCVFEEEAALLEKAEIPTEFRDGIRFVSIRDGIRDAHPPSILLILNFKPCYQQPQFILLLNYQQFTSINFSYSQFQTLIPILGYKDKPNTNWRFFVKNIRDLISNYTKSIEELVRSEPSEPVVLFRQIMNLK
ncbi:hypothetical protein MTR_3g036455 [Medicago truncatula]|uniref:Uncharacterized protein n=1 Tax=Medicago truncatula TaxID=3880 RepID=A0A072UUC5_MEDTR|nr:hypothetical protein MTR_3g036455 [Medicago truncatula]